MTNICALVCSLRYLLDQKVHPYFKITHTHMHIHRKSSERARRAVAIPDRSLVVDFYSSQSEKCVP